MLTNKLLAALAATALTLLVVPGCAADSTGDDGEDDSATSESSALSGGVQDGETLQTTANLNLRSGPGTNHSILAVIPDGADVKVVSPNHTNGFYNVQWNGHTGWSSGLYLRQVSSGGGATAASANGEVARAREWVNVAMPYCGGSNGGHDYICGGTCYRHGAANNAAWNAYRSDCSGLVSFAWGLRAPGLTTAGFAPFSGAESYLINGANLQPGDALNSVPSEHIVLFAGWVDRAAGKARIIEEYNCGHPATEHILTLHVSGTSVYIPDWFPHDYRAIRHR